MPEGSTKYIQAPDVSWNKPFKATCTKKEWLAGYRGNSRRNSCWKFEIIPEKYHFGVNSWFLSRATHRGNKKKLSRAACWTFPWTTWFTAPRNDSLVAVHDYCFYRSCKFWVSKAQIPLNVPVLILREHIRHYIFWIRIMKRTETLKLGELCSLYFTLSIAVVLTRRLWNWGQALERVFVFYN